MPCPAGVVNVGYVLIGGTTIDLEERSEIPWAGPPGPTGPTGPTGSTGAVGATGATGASGSTLISSQVLGAAVATVTFSSIPGSYSHLELIIIGRMSDSALAESIDLQFNADTAAHYDGWYMHNVPGSGISSVIPTTKTNIRIGTLPGATATAGVGGSIRVRIPGYTGTTFDKTLSFDSMSYQTTTAGQKDDLYGHGIWLSTAAITSIVLSEEGAGNFIIGSRFDLYGIT